MPFAFIGHGSPMNTLELNVFTQSWRALGRALPRPRAVLAISAHWFIQATAVTAMARPKVIHDFYGFPPELFAFDYPAAGSPEVADEIVAILGPGSVGLDRSSWGLDHGTWSALAYHVDLGARLAPLRDRGVLIVGSGNVVHNLRRVDWSFGDRGFDWAERFDARVREVMTTNPGALADVQRDPDHALAVPTAEHFLPLAYVAGLCSAAGETAQPFAEGRTLGSLSMTSYLVGMAMPATDGSGDAAQSLPREVPPEQTNS